MLYIYTSIFLKNSKHQLRCIENYIQLQYFLKFSSKFNLSKLAFNIYSKGNAGRKMAVAKYPACHGNNIDIDKFNVGF